MVDSPDQRQLKLQKGAHFTNEMKNTKHTLRIENTQGFTETHIPHTTGYAFLARFGVCLGGTLRGYASGSVEVPPLRGSKQVNLYMSNWVFFRNTKTTHMCHMFSPR